MEREIIILVENKNKVVATFIDLMNSKNSVSFRELRKIFPSTASYDIIQLFIYKVNNSIKSIHQTLEIFELNLCKKGNKIHKTYSLNKGIKIETTEDHIILCYNHEKE